ncbi:MAG: hypothetical protein QM537_08015 [Candidatus Symbiobacter sp.]|nr:hypothetical protein [Candidatus Symbiobacter sp.]
MNDKQHQEVARYLIGLAIVATISFVGYMWGHVDISPISAILLFLMIPILFFGALYFRRDK